MKEAIRAKHGEKMIKVELYFWTNKIADEKGYVVPKVAWNAGWQNLLANKTHGLKRDAEPFHSLGCRSETPL